jgi:hypoxanthine phosphoribosyltransferase
MKEKVIVTTDGKVYRLLKNRKEIEAKVKELAIRIKQNYPNAINPPILLFVMTGGLYLGVDLSRVLAELQFKFNIDYVSLKRNYDQDGNVEILNYPRTRLNGRDVIVVEDLIDEGLTMNFLHLLLTSSSFDLRSLQYCTLFMKKHHKELSFKVKYLGWEIGPNWLIGNGMDSDECYRGQLDVYQSES